MRVLLFLSWCLLACLAFPQSTQAHREHHQNQDGQRSFVFRGLLSRRTTKGGPVRQPTPLAHVDNVSRKSTTVKKIAMWEPDSWPATPTTKDHEGKDFKKNCGDKTCKQAFFEGYEDARANFKGKDKLERVPDWLFHDMSFNFNPCRVQTVKRSPLAHPVGVLPPEYNQRLLAWLKYTGTHPPVPCADTSKNIFSFDAKFNQGRDSSDRETCHLECRANFKKGQDKVIRSTWESIPEEFGFKTDCRNFEGLHNQPAMWWYLGAVSAWVEFGRDGLVSHRAKHYGFAFTFDYSEGVPPKRPQRSGTPEWHFDLSYHVGLPAPVYFVASSTSPTKFYTGKLEDLLGDHKAEFAHVCQRTYDIAKSSQHRETEESYFTFTQVNLLKSRVESAINAYNKPSTTTVKLPELKLPCKGVDECFSVVPAECNKNPCCNMLPLTSTCFPKTSEWQKSLKALETYLTTHKTVLDTLPALKDIDKDFVPYKRKGGNVNHDVSWRGGGLWDRRGTEYFNLVDMKLNGMISFEPAGEYPLHLSDLTPQQKEDIDDMGMYGLLGYREPFLKDVKPAADHDGALVPMSAYQLHYAGRIEGTESHDRWFMRMAIKQVDDIQHWKGEWNYRDLMVE